MLHFYRDHIKSSKVTDDFLIWSVSPLTFQNGSKLETFYLRSDIFLMDTLETIFNLIGAAMIAIMWLRYFHQVDLFQKNSWLSTAAMFIGGIAAAYVVIFLASFKPEWDFIDGYNSEWYIVLVEIIVEVAIIEEFVKYTLFALLLFIFSKKMDEPVDLILHAGIVALGFATLENFLYFEQPGATLIARRGIISTLGHIIDSGIIAYAIVLINYRQHPVFLTFLKYFGIAVAFHALFNFSLSAYKLNIPNVVGVLAAYFVFLYAVQFYSVMLNNCLNNSPHYDQSKYRSPRSISLNIFAFYAIFIIYQLIVDLILEDEDTAKINFFGSLYLTLIIVVGATVRIGRFQLERDQWIPIKLQLPLIIGRSEGSRYVSFGVRGPSPMQILIRSLEGEKVDVRPLNKKGQRNLDLPRSGVVTEVHYTKEGDIRAALKLRLNLDLKDEFFIFAPKINGEISVKGKYPIVKLNGPYSEVTMKDICHPDLRFSDMAYLKYHEAE